MKHVIDSVLLPKGNSAPAVAGLSASDVAARISKAINVGAPLWNQGDKEGCVAIYEATAREIVAENGVGSARLSQALQELPGQSTTAKGWTLRNAFDEVLATIESTPVAGTAAYGAPVTGWTTDISTLRWNVVNDRVMGGVSDSTVRTQAGVVDFSGYVTTASNGGFATARGESASVINLSGCRGIAFEAKGDNVRFEFGIRTGRGWRGDQYEADFTPNPTVWTRYEMNFNDFDLNQMGFNLGGQLNPASIYGFGLKRSAFLNGLQKDPSFKPSNFKLQVRGVECLR